MCSSIGSRTATPYFWLQTNKHRTSNQIGPLLELQNYSSNILEHPFFECQNIFKHVHSLVIELEHPIFGF